MVRRGEAVEVGLVESLRGLARHGSYGMERIGLPRYGEMVMDNQILTIKEAAKICRVHRTVLDSLVKVGAIPHARFSQRVVRIDRDELLQWIKNGGLNGGSQEGR